MQDDGSTYRDHLEVMVDRGRKDESELLGPERPPALEYIWEWFVELAGCRTAGMAGVNPITFADIDAWARLTDRVVRPHEVRALVEIDVVMRSKRKGE